MIDEKELMKRKRKTKTKKKKYDIHVDIEQLSYDRLRFITDIKGVGIGTILSRDELLYLYNKIGRYLRSF